MALFFGKKKQEELKLEGKESVVSSEEVLEQSTTSEEEEVTTQISFHPEWNLAQEDIYAFQFLNMELPPLKPNQISISGISMVQTEEGYAFTAFLRHSLNKAIKLETTKIALLDGNDQLIGRKAFDLTNVGELPAASSRPWTFVFTEKDLLKNDIPVQGWKLAFVLEETKEKHSLDLDSTWKKSLDSAAKKQLKDLVDRIDPPKKGEVNFLGVQAKFTADDSLHVTLLIRNGGNKSINLEQIPLQVEDANGDIVAKGGFKVGKLEVKANTSKPWNFIFPPAMVVKRDADFSRWKAYAPNN
ncbi:accessory Sec system S-layer assembly protein [Evansella sp. AB-rgal1]|uniref:accessory Sec system S-layer assembly protein n=1 Tax=Evansella sp. AB-rgal1 TaxID=3242696 RepID=UPI00359E4ADE